jgi:ABC-type glycerol-3-phosphate transport system substrate-binding protein
VLLEGVPKDYIKKGTNMKKNLWLVGLALIALVGCGKKTSSSLKVSVYLGGYGKVWINNLAREFEAENPGVTVEIETNPDLAAEIPNRLQNGSNDDVFFSHGINWERMAVQGYIEQLDDLYQEEIDGIKLKDKIEPSLLSTASFNSHYYKLPYTNGVGGIVYNAKMFRDNNWNVPATYDELLALCQTIENAKIKVDPTSSKPNAPTITPFVWSQETYYWDYLVFDWWAQLDGIDFFRDYVKLESPEVFNPDLHPGHYKALEAWANLVAKHPKWSVEDSVGKQYMAAQMDFLNGYAAMIPNAQWLEMEMSNNIDPSKFEMAIMEAPVLNDAKKDANGNVIKVNYAVGAGDSIIIPKKAPHKDLAKKFLLFLGKDSSLKIFTEKTNGVMLGFDYSNVTLDNSSLSKFTNDVVNINKTSTKFNLYSNSLLKLDGKVGLEWPPEDLQYYATYFNHYNNLDYLQDPAGWLLAGNEKNVKNTFVDAYNVIKSHWSQWNSEVN